MSMRIVLNGREVMSPAAKFGLSFAAVLGAAVMTALVVFVLLPLIGIAVTLSVSLFVIILVATVAGIVSLLLGSLLFAWLVGPVEFFVERMRQRKP